MHQVSLRSLLLKWHLLFFRQLFHLARDLAGNPGFRKVGKKDCFKAGCPVRAQGPFRLHFQADNNELAYVNNICGVDQSLSKRWLKLALGVVRLLFAVTFG